MEKSIIVRHQIIKIKHHSKCIIDQVIDMRATQNGMYECKFTIN